MTSGNNVFGVFGEDHAVRLTGVTHGQLRHWRYTKFFAPSFELESGASGYGKVYTFRDIVALRVLGVLRNQYAVSLQHLRQVKERLTATNSGVDAWTGVKLYVQDHKVIWAEPGTERPQVVATGQYLLPTIELDAVVAATRGEIKALTRRDPSTVGHVERRRMVNQNSAVVAGTRIPVRAIKRFHEAGYSVDQIIEEYPDLSADDVAAALAYRSAA